MGTAKWQWLRLATVIGVLTQVTSLHAETELPNKAKFEKLFERLKPDASEPWRTIDWKIDLLDAQRTAASQRKPIFVWAMDGHPLGCT